MYSSVAEHEGRMERTWDDHSACAGWELVEEVDWAEEARDISLLPVLTNFPLNSSTLGTTAVKIVKDLSR